MMRLFAEGSSTAGPQSYRLDGRQPISSIWRHVEKETLETQSGSLTAEASASLTGAELDTFVNRPGCFCNALDALKCAKQNVQDERLMKRDAERM